MLRLVAQVAILGWLSVAKCQGQEAEYLVPPPTTGYRQDLPSGQGRSLGLALDYESLDKARSIFPLVFTAPARIYILVFNTTGVVKVKRVDSGWSGVDSWMTQEGLSQGTRNGQSVGPLRLELFNGFRSDTRGGAAMYALLSLAQALPPASSLALVTSRPVSDTDLAVQAQTALLEKKIPLTVFWTGKKKTGRSWLEEIAINTGGKLVDRSDDVNSLKQVTLLVRDNLKGDTRNKVEIDSSLKELILTVKGKVRSATLLPPTGYALDGLDGGNQAVSKKTIELNGGETGTWYLDVRAADEPYNITVDAKSHLALWARTTNNSAEHKKKVVELWLEGRGVRRVDEIELVDAEGKQLAALGHRETRSQDNTVSSTVELDTYATRQPAFLRLTATNNNGEQFTRLTRIPDEMRLPTSVEVGLGSMLTSSPGQRAIIYFNVANNRRQPMYYDYVVKDKNGWVRYVQPQRSMINGMSVDQVKVEVQAPYGSEAQTQQPDVVTLRAQLTTGESVTQKAYFTVGQTNYDSTSPSIWYDYNGDCSNTLGPDNCYIGTWGANVSLQDTGSGLLQITSRPIALQLEREFIAGTTDQINARFTATCCQTKVEVTATDTLGNKYTKIIDIERKWLSAGEISAIVLGSILLLLFILIISILIWWCCCRRNRKSLAIYPDH